MMVWIKDWLPIILPLALLIASLSIGFWLRRWILRLWKRWTGGKPWGESITAVLNKPWLILWVVIPTLALSFRLSPIPKALIPYLDKTLWSIFILSLTWVVARTTVELVRFFSPKFSSFLPPSLAERIAGIGILTIGILIWLDGLGLPLTPLLILLGVIIIVVIFSFRDALSDIAAFLQILTTKQVKEGDFIKLETGQEGYIMDIKWRMTQLEGLNGQIVFIPNSKLAQSIIARYHRPLPKAKHPFFFYTRLLLRELTGLSASSLKDLVEKLKEVQEAVIYYHTHHFVQEHQYLNPQPPNDFAYWVSEILDEAELGERLANINPLEFNSLQALRERLIAVIEEYLLTHPNTAEAPPGKEFHFIKGVSIVISTGYIAHDLREFAEVLREVSIDSLYYHVFESHLRSGRGRNDFSFWLETSLGEKELAKEIDRLDPYTFTLEALRSTILNLIEQRLKER